LELFVNYNFVTINPKPDKRNGKSIANRQELLVAKFPEIVSSNGHPPKPQPTASHPIRVNSTLPDDEVWTGPIDPLTPEDKEVCCKAADAKNGNKFKSLYRGEIPEGKHSEADLAFVNIVAFYTNSKERVVRIFHNSELGKRVKAYREDYLHSSEIRDHYEGV
jgi:hypothetical protein